MTEIIVILQEKRSRVIEDVTNWVPVTAISRPGHMIHLVDRFSPDPKYGKGFSEIGGVANEIVPGMHGLTCRSTVLLSPGGGSGTPACVGKQHQLNDKHWITNCVTQEMNPQLPCQ